MNLPRCLLLFCCVALCPLVPAHAADPDPESANPVFGPYEAIVYDAATLQGVRVDANRDIFLMFQPEKCNAQVRIRISMAKGAQYRKWFTGDDELVAQENAFRAPNSWTDRVQTTANYIEYRDGEHLFLHLKKIED